MERLCNIVHIWIVDSLNNYLIQRRSQDKVVMPGMWTITGGKTMYDEDCLSAANREVMEELGIDLGLCPQDLSFVHLGNQANVAVYIKKVYTPLQLTIKEDELDAIMWVTLEKIRKMRDQGRFWAPAYFDQFLIKTGDI